MALKVGIQLYSVRDEMKKDPINAIRQVAEIGYKNLEFASSNADTDPGVGFGVSVEDMQKLLKETGANLISGHIRPINEETITRRWARSTSASPQTSTPATTS